MNPATALARLTVQALAAAGVGHVVLCPGSRSAPLAYELARTALDGPGPPHPSSGLLTLHVRHDERVAAFVALGAGLSPPTVGAVVTTSGTAAANLHPAVLEAHHANRPLVVITADRPPALRGTWANQTSDLQAAVFGDAVRARLDLADVDASKDPEAAEGALIAVLAAARGLPSGRPGPVHLNLGFTEPLLPDAEPASPRGHPSPTGDHAGEAGSASLPCQEEVPGTPVPLTFPTAARTVVLAGDRFALAGRYAERAGFPLLAEPSSGARRGPNAIGPYRLLLELPEFGGAIERVVVFGRPTLSRPVTGLLQRPDVEIVLVSPYGDWPDPGRPVRRMTFPGSSELFALPDPSDGADLPPRGSEGPDPWLTRWRAAGAAAAAAVDAVLDGEGDAGRLTGPGVAREVWSAMRPGEDLVVAASNPIRDLDLAGHPPPGGGPGVHANRGLSGIDGTISTATGLALTGGRVTLLTGDVAFLHDAGGLLAPSGEQRPDLRVVVLNDDGGGIFSLLEYGRLAEAGGPDGEARAEFDRLFGTPHGADVAAICRGYHVPHERVDDVRRLREVLAESPRGTSVVEVRADRHGLRDLHARLRTAVHTAVAPLG